MHLIIRVITSNSGIKLGDLFFNRVICYNIRHFPHVNENLKFLDLP